MQEVILVVHLLIALALIGVVLLQRSEGGALGIGGGGGGGGGNLFSARGVGDGLTRATAWLAAAFFVTSITLGVLASKGGNGSILDRVLPSSGTAPATTQQAPADGAGSGTSLPQLQPSQPDTPQVPVNP